LLICYAGCRLSLSVVVVCYAAGCRAGWPPGAWTVGALAAGLVGGRAADTDGGPVVLRLARATPCF